MTPQHTPPNTKNVFHLTRNVVADTRNWVSDNAIKLTAAGYITGNIVEGVTSFMGQHGGLGSPLDRQIASGILLSGATLMWKYGKKDLGLAAALTVNQVGYYFATKQGMADGQLGVTAGFALNGAAMGFAWMTQPLEHKFGTFGNQLKASTQKLRLQGGSTMQVTLQGFKEYGSALVRKTLGHPHKMMATNLALSNVPWVVDAVMNKQWGWLGVVGCFVVGDSFSFLAKTEAEQHSKDQVPNRPKLAPPANQLPEKLDKVA